MSRVFARKESRRSTDAPRRPSFAGHKALTLAPPPYGVDLVDRSFARHVHHILRISRHNEEQEEQLQAQRQHRDEQDVSAEVEAAINRKRGGGQALDRGTRTQMGAAFDADFSAVRVHTDSEADTLSRALGARAFTTGRDVFFRQGEYSPATGSGQELLAHELTHVVQQNGDDISRQLAVSRPGDPAEREADAAARRIVAGEPTQSAQAKSMTTRIFSGNRWTLQRWTNLGTESWTIRGLGSRSMTVWTGSQAEWRSALQEMDDRDEYEASLWGFLTVSNDPAIVNHTRAPSHIGNVPYTNTIVRAPNDAEKLEFLRALYEGGNMDLWHGGVWEGGPWIHYADRDLATFIRNNQGKLIAEVSARGALINSSAVQAIAGQGGREATMAMIMNAGATAHKGVDLVMTANRQSGQSRETAHAQAYETVRNAGRVIREALKAHDARVAFQQQIVGQIFDTVWGTIPGGGTLTNAAKSILKAGLSQGLKKSQEESGPRAQAESINEEFISTCNQLVFAGHITSSDAQDAINGFEAVRR